MGILSCDCTEYWIFAAVHLHVHQHYNIITIDYYFFLCTYIRRDGVNGAERVDLAGACMYGVVMHWQLGGTVGRYEGHIRTRCRCADAVGRYISPMVLCTVYRPPFFGVLTMILYDLVDFYLSSFVHTVCTFNSLYAFAPLRLYAFTRQRSSRGKGLMASPLSR